METDGKTIEQVEEEVESLFSELHFRSAMITYLQKQSYSPFAQWLVGRNREVCVRLSGELKLLLLDTDKRWEERPG